VGGTADETVAGFSGWIDTPAGRVPRISSRWGTAERLGAFRVRWGIGRNGYAVPPGLYGVGDPDADSPVVATANYKLTFDLVRRALSGRSAWLLVLETHGINVWCAAGKGTFGTEELVSRIAATGLSRVVRHHTILLPLLSATGVCARQVRFRSRFEARFAAVRADSLPEYLDGGLHTTDRMRELTFTLRERAALVPVELVQGIRAALPWLLALTLAGRLASGTFLSAAVLLPAALFLSSLLLGAAAVPLLLPWLPGRAFAPKGALLGLAAAAAAAAVSGGALPVAAWAAAFCALPALSAFFALNFTGATPYTSRSGVKKEIRRALPPVAAGTAGAFAAWIALLLGR
jgi:acetyl-CoA decarbonylase/synthase complex subunit gamma